MENNTLHTIYILGNAYTVPAGFTIMSCMEYVGFRLSHGCGCRGAVCGACAVLYRVGCSPKWHVGLACQTLTQDQMNFMSLPYHEGPSPRLDMHNIPCTLEEIDKIHPNFSNCNACNTCSQGCPVGIKVLGALHALRQGSFAKMRRLSMECILCGMCAVRCPKQVAPMQVLLTARRLFTKDNAIQTPDFLEGLKRSLLGQWHEDIAKYKAMSQEEMLAQYKKFQAKRGGGINS